MSGTKLSSLAGASPLSLSDLFYAVQTPGVGGTKATLAQLETLFSASFLGLTGVAADSSKLGGTAAASYLLSATAASTYLALSGGTLTGSLTLGGNISAAAWTTAGIKLKGGGSTLTDTTSSGTVALAVTNKLGGNTIAASSATTYTDYGTLYLDVPAAGTNVTITNPWSLIASGAMKSTALTLTGGTLTLNGATSGASVLSAPAVAGSATITLPGVTSTLATLGANTFTGDQTVGSSNLVGWSTDLKLYRDAAGTLAQRNGANAQTLRVYNTFTDASNNEYLSLGWSSNIATIESKANGTGTARTLRIRGGGYNVIEVSPSGDAILCSGGGQVSFGGSTSSYPAFRRSGTLLQVRLGDNSADGPVSCSYVKTGSTTVAGLPSASTAGSGARAFVTDANATTFLSTVAGGGANKVPVVSDGTNWIIG